MDDNLTAQIESITKFIQKVLRKHSHLVHDLRVKLINLDDQTRVLFNRDEVNQVLESFDRAPSTLSLLADIRQSKTDELCSTLEAIERPIIKHVLEQLSNFLIAIEEGYTLNRRFFEAYQILMGIYENPLAPSSLSSEQCDKRDVVISRAAVYMLDYLRALQRARAFASYNQS